MSARDDVLARVRSAVAVGATRTTVHRTYRGAGTVQLAPAERLELLADRLIDYKAGVTRTDDAGVAQAIADRLALHRVLRLVVPAGAPSCWLDAVVAVERVVDDSALSAHDLDTVSGTISGCAVAIAETGTIVLDGSAGQGRRALSLVPDYLLLVVRAEQVVTCVPDALPRLDPLRPLTWISGPSATSDIELNRVEGVHGPRVLDVVLVD